METLDVIGFRNMFLDDCDAYADDGPFTRVIAFISSFSTPLALLGAQLLMSDAHLDMWREKIKGTRVTADESADQRILWTRQQPHPAHPPPPTQRPTGQTTAHPPPHVPMCLLCFPQSSADSRRTTRSISSPAPPRRSGLGCAAPTDVTTATSSLLRCTALTCCRIRPSQVASSATPHTPACYPHAGRMQAPFSLNCQLPLCVDYVHRQKLKWDELHQLPVRSVPATRVFSDQAPLVSFNLLIPPGLQPTPQQLGRAQRSGNRQGMQSSRQSRRLLLEQESDQSGDSSLRAVGNDKDKEQAVLEEQPLQEVEPSLQEDDLASVGEEDEVKVEDAEADGAQEPAAADAEADNAEADGPYEQEAEDTVADVDDGQVYTDEARGELPPAGEARTAKQWETLAISHLFSHVDLEPDDEELSRRTSLLLAVRAEDRGLNERFKDAARRLVSQSDLTNNLIDALDYGSLDDWYKCLVRRDHWQAFGCQCSSHLPHASPPPLPTRPLHRT